jgi:MFS family permease
VQIKALGALSERNFFWYWLSGLGTTGAQGIQQLAVAWLVLDITGSVGQLGLVIFLQGVPMSGVAMIGGVLADRYSRRRLVEISQVVVAANLVILAALTLTDAILIWEVYVSSLIAGAMLSVTGPARAALVRSVISDERLPQGIALTAMQQQGSRIVWPTLTGGLIGLLGVAPALLLAATASCWGVLALTLVRGIDERQQPTGKSPLADAIAGFQHIWRTPRLRGLESISLAAGSFGLAFQAIVPGFARQVLDFSAGETGLLLMVSGAASLLGSLSMVFFEMGDRLRRLAFGYGAFVLAILLIAINPFDSGAFILMAAYGVSLGLISVAGQTLLQRNTPPELLGRVVSVWNSAGGIGFLIALPLGVLGDAYGLRWALGGGAAIILVWVSYRALVFGFPPYSDATPAEPKPQPIEAS